MSEYFLCIIALIVLAYGFAIIVTAIDTGIQWVRGRLS